MKYGMVVGTQRGKYVKVVPFKDGFRRGGVHRVEDGIIEDGVVEGGIVDAGKVTLGVISNCCSCQPPQRPALTYMTW